MRVRVEKTRRNLRVRTDFLPEVHLWFKYLNPGIGFNGAEENCVSCPKIVHAQVPRVSNDQTSWIYTIHLRQKHSEIEVYDTRVAPGPQFENLGITLVSLTVAVAIAAIDIPCQGHWTLSEPLHDDESIV
jgi:hypothetical protein